MTESAKKPINLMAGLRDLGSSKTPGQKMGITVRSDDLWFDPDDKPMAKSVAIVCVARIREMLEQGKAPGGTPLPAMKASTDRRRDVEIDQAERGGQAHERFNDNEFRHMVKNNYTRDYVAQKLGGFDPGRRGGRGILSGMLLASFSARPARDGRGVNVYVAQKRGAPRPGNVRPAETKSALEVVMAGAPIWDKAAMNATKVKAAIEESLTAMLSKSLAGFVGKRKDVLKALGKLGGELVDTFESLGSLADEVTED